MKKKVLLKSVAAVMSLLTLAPYFWEVTQVEASNNKLCNWSDQEGDQRSQYKRQRGSNEEDVTEQNLHKNPKLDICNLLNHEEGSTEEGSTEEGSTEEGSTEGGSTEGGSTEEGSTEGGSTEEGSTEGGSTEEGSTEEGSTEEGSTEEGSTEEGSTNETQFKLPGLESVLKSLSSEEEQHSQCKRQRCSTEEIGYVKKIACGFYLPVTSEKVGNYIVANIATNKQAAENFGVAALNPKLFENNIKNICQKQLTPEEVMDYIVKNYGTCAEDGIAINQSDRRRKFNLKELVMFILQYTYIPRQKVANYFGVSEVKIDAYLYRLKEKNELLYNTIKNRLDKPSLPETAEEVFEFIFYTNAVAEEVASYYGVSDDTVNSRFRDNKFIQERHKPIAYFNRNRARGVEGRPLNKDITPEVIGEYIVATYATYGRVADHFKTTFMPVFYAVEKLFDTPFYDDVKKVACGFPLAVTSERDSVNSKRVIVTPEIIGEYIVRNNATYEQAAEYFGISTKSVQIYLQILQRKKAI